jgi:uncharacterized phage protein gp47/JayE
MAIRTSDELIQQAINYITAWRPDVDTSVGTLVKDIVIDIPATILGLAYQDLQQIQKASSINYVDELTDSQVEDLAANYNLTRKQGSYATGVVYFYKNARPTTIITIGNADGTGGVSVSTSNADNGQTYGFTTVETKQLTPDNADSFYNAANNRYEVPITIQANAIGTAYNVAAYSIQNNKLINEIDGVVNYNGCQGGLDIETNAQLAERIKTAAQARLLGTIPGYKTLVDSFEQVVDSSIVDTTMADYIRNTYGNEIDVIVIGTQVQAYTATANISDGITYVLPAQPVISINSITGEYGGEQVTFIENTDYKFVPDKTSDYRYSAKAQDKIYWIGNQPSGDYTIQYSANKLIIDLQQTLDSEQNHLLGSDVLVREGIEIPVQMALEVNTYSGTNPTSTEIQIKNVIQQYVNNLKLGEKLEQSDIVYELRTQLDAIIDNITLPFTIFSEKGISASANILTCSRYEYFRIDTTDIKVTIN